MKKISPILLIILLLLVVVAGVFLFTNRQNQKAVVPVQKNIPVSQENNVVPVPAYPGGPGAQGANTLPTVVPAPVVPRQALPPGTQPPRVDSLKPAPPVQAVPAIPPAVSPK